MRYVRSTFHVVATIALFLGFGCGSSPSGSGSSSSNPPSSGTYNSASCAATPPINGAETVTVDFSSDQGPVTRRASGFLHGAGSVAPSTSVLNNLGPRFFRGDDNDDMMDPSTYSRLNSFGAAQMFVLGDGWWDNQYGYNPSNVRVVTSSTMSAWNSYVAQAVNTAKANGQVFQWDIWNEPDLSANWTGTEAQYQAMWLNAVNTIRGIDPSQIIVGPSTCCSPWSTWATDLLTFAKANNVLPNVLAIHENTSPAQLESDVSAARTWLAANTPSITTIEITEMVDQSSDYLPGMNIQYIAAAERAGVGAAVHSCWHSDCFDQSLDGLIQTNGTTYTAIMYAYEGYAQISGRLVGVTPSAHIDGVAGQNSGTSQANSVFGTTGWSGPVNVTYNNINVISNYVNSSGLIHVSAYFLSNDNGAGSGGATQFFSGNMAPSNNSLTVPITSFGSNGAVIIHLSPGAGSSCP